MTVQIYTPKTGTVEVDGYPVPYIEAGESGNAVSLILDSRFGIDTSQEELERWLPFLANAMAVAAGRTSHGANSNIRNPHGENLAGYPTERILGEPVSA